MECDCARRLSLTVERTLQIWERRTSGNRSQAPYAQGAKAPSMDVDK